ncbi:MAG: TIGR03545 family protein [Planctomycetaceae bacterium]|nr:TIGR03545 family protein [Planctomycetaceae bacterium]
MRWTWIVPRVLIVAFLWAFIAFGMDPLLRYGAVQALQSITGAKADVAKVETHFFPPTVTVDNVALASAGRPGKNILEFDQMRLQLEPDSLSRRRLVVEDGSITGLRLDTRRSDDGQLEKSPEPVSEEPSWMTEKMMELGDEWLNQLTEQAKAQLDPNTLETYRTGTEMYEKWDARFEDMSERVKEMKPRVLQLKAQFKQAKEGDTLEQIEKYLVVAERAEAIVLEVQQFRDELKDIVPEVRTDFEELNAARQRDQEAIMHKISLLKPDGRRISQALLGKTMYRQLQQLLTWVEAAKEYQAEWKSQIQPPRSVGRDFPILVQNPAPDVVFKKLALSGQISVQEELVPFTAEIADITEDPKLLNRPCVMRLRADGSRPLQMRLTWDATKETPRAELLADYRDTNAIPLRAGKEGDAMFQGTLSDLAWTTTLEIVGVEMQGQIQLQSKLDRLSFEASEDVRPEIVEAANEALGNVQTLDAMITLGGTLAKPDIDLKSDVGDQIAEGVQEAFFHQLEVARDRLVVEVNDYANDHLDKLKSRFAGEYEKLKNDNQELLEQVNEVRTIVASLQSGKADPAMLVKQVANSKLIPEKEQKKVQKIMGDVDAVMQGQLPSKLKDKVPALESDIQKKLLDKAPKLPDGTRILPGNLQNGLPGAFPGLMRGASSQDGSKPATQTGLQGLPANAFKGAFPGLRSGFPVRPASRTTEQPSEQ